MANSLVGVKPTVGLVSRTGILPISSTQDTPGPMARSVSDAAALLTALTGIDPRDPATARSGGVVGNDYTRALSRTALAGARIGMTSGPGGSQGAAYNRAVAVLRAQGATVVPVTVNGGGLPPSILAYEFKRDLNAYLAQLPAGAPMRALDDIVRFNIANADQNTMRFGQTQLVQSNNINLNDPRLRATYEANRDNGIATARQRIDSVLRGQSLDAILFFGSGSAGIGARAQYPSVAVPIGYDPSSGRPIGMSLLGTAFTEARLLALAFAYEQAAQVWRPPPEVNAQPSAIQRGQADAGGDCVGDDAAADGRPPALALPVAGVAGGPGDGQQPQGGPGAEEVLAEPLPCLDLLGDGAGDLDPSPR